MLKFSFSPFPFLNTERLNLRPLSMADAKEVLEIRSNERVMKYIDRPRARNIEDAINHINMVEDSIANNKAINWAIAIKGSASLIGTIGYYRMKPEHHRAEVGYVLHPDYHGKGIMSEAIRAVLAYGFQKMKLHSIEAVVSPNNEKSIAVLEKHQFIQEGLFKENFYFQGSFLDSAVYSLLRSQTDY